MSHVIVIGMFDGLHIGHQALLARAIAEGNEREMLVTVVTFSTHPASIMRPDTAPARIMSDADRLGALRAYPGIHHVEVLDFTPEMQATAAHDFVQTILRDQLDGAVVVVGENFRFGQGALGDVELMGELIETVVPPLTTLDGTIVSSTAIRQALSTGHVQRATAMLGRFHELSGVIIHGDQRGRTIGFPTANFDIPSGMAIPDLGVYAGIMRSPQHHNIIAAISIGHNTTFGGTKELRVEAHFLDFDEDLYGQTLTISFIERLRGQERYANVRALIDQLQHDCDRTRDAIDERDIF